VKKIKKEIVIVGALFVLVVLISGCSDSPDIPDFPKADYRFRIYYVYENESEINPTYWEDPTYIQATIEKASHIIKNYTNREISYDLILMQTDTDFIDKAKETGNLYNVMGSSYWMDRIELFCEAAYKTNFDDAYKAYDYDIFIFEGVEEGGFNTDGVSFIGTDWFKPFPREDEEELKYYRGATVVHEFLHSFGCEHEDSNECFMTSIGARFHGLTAENLCSCEGKAFNDSYSLRISATKNTMGIVCLYNGTYFNVAQNPAPIASIISMF